MNVLDVFRRKGAQLFWRRIADDHVIEAAPGPASGAPIDAGEAYFVLRLAEMYLGTSRTLWRKAYPLVHGFTNYNGREEHNVAGPGQLQEIGGGNLDRLIILNSRLAGPTPFTGGDVSVLVGLWSVAGDDAAKALVTTVSAVSGLLGAVGPPVAQIVDVVKSSVEKILNLDQTVLRLGVNDTFFPGNPLRAGFYVGIGATAATVDVNRLWLRAGHLVAGTDPVVAKPYNDHDYFVVQVERREVRDDWPALPAIREFNDHFGAAMGAAEPVATKRQRLAGLWPGFVQALTASEHLTAAHAAKIQNDVAADLTARLDALEHGNPFETKAWGSDITQVRPPNLFDLADVPDYVVLGQAGSPPSFLP
jgi:hypothetical protein